jgi:hypothetical protein
MASAKIRVNPDCSLVEIEAEGVTFEPEDYPEQGDFVLVADPDTGIGHLALLEDIGPLKGGVVYRLTPVSTEVEENAEFEEDDEDEDDGDVLVEAQG